MCAKMSTELAIRFSLWILPIFQYQISLNTVSTQPLSCSDICELLLEAEADVDHCDAAGRSPLWVAASMGHADVVSLLLFWGCTVDTIDIEGRTVLSVASAQGNVSVVNQLLHRGEQSVKEAATISGRVDRKAIGRTAGNNHRPTSDQV